MAPRAFKGKLRNKIFLFMALVGVVPLLIAAALTYYVVMSSHRDDVAKVETSALTETANEVQAFIVGSVLTQTSVEIPYGGNIFSTSSVPAQQYVLQETLSALPFIESEAYVNLAGQETAAADQAHLMGVASSSLANVASSPGFQSAKAGADYLGPVTYSGTPLEPSVAFASPVTDSGGEIIGVIAGTASLQPLENIVASSRIGSTGYLYLVDQDGAIIAGGSGAPASGENFGNDIGSKAAADSPLVPKVIGGTDATSSAAQARYANLFGTPVVAAGKALAEDGQYWGLIAEWPTSEADAVVSALLLRDALMLLVTFGVIVLLSILLALIIVRPIDVLEEGTERVAQGKFNEGVNIKTGDELEELGDEFNKMVLGLKELEQLKDEFVFIAAHELRTPVAAMKGYLQLILDGSTGAIPDPTRDFIRKVIASNDRLIQLVNDLLEVARSQAGRLTIKVAAVDISPQISSTLEELKSLADEKGVAMAYDPAIPITGDDGAASGTPLPKVMADPDRVKEVVVNLIGNAIKYMGGSGTITVTHALVAAAPSLTPDGRDLPAMLMTRIADTGLGISKEAQEKLFEKFYRVQTDRTKDIQGTGLGLFIVKEIIEKMGGTISVVSEEGKGSTFSFALKVAE